VNRDLETLQRWAAEKATTDEDIAARPLWDQIANEVGDYLTEGSAPGDADVPLFGGL
jgi:hypothetical protein